ncbi:MAG TPA: arsenate reductase ArsC [Thermoplasmatales archaeon]|nr:arsenate reductase ArsC [Thermoplasmatales archaeon]
MGERMKKILFVCVENACRSQMAEVLFNSMAKDMIAESAGIKPAERIDEKAVEVMREIGLDVSDKKPKLLTPDMNDIFDIIVTMGCMDNCPVTPKEKTIEWNIEDPKGSSIEKFREIREIIQKQIESLLEMIE